jgi:hypothetical protein
MAIKYLKRQLKLLLQTITKQEKLFKIFLMILKKEEKRALKK